ncbi:polysaccharide deacetylase family protein [Mycobacterium deserti]|uniref:Polysaccharide deacetylase family protein n=1 Tax=Mycobacterium deserti TaxID=2978347 RepID=A0ABT2MKA9_9MYCO|nr:polysaccharide deacetylase family protein [Mycobacterium deserti]MCT7661530.1 polysaccharide deacetylase family protein [Mycobacterium deserti]
MDRRHFLVGLSALTLAGIGLTQCSSTAQPQAAQPTPVAAAQPRGAGLLPPPPRSARVALPGGGVLSTLPGNGDLLALTLDDGVSSEVVRLYTQFAKDTGLRLTYFVNGIYRSWTDNRDLLRPLVDSGQIQLGNHTWSHPDLTTLPLTQVAEEFRRNHEFLWKVYGVDARPYFRPPYGRHNAHVDKLSGDLGYTTTTMWSGDLKDHVVIPEAEIVKMAHQYFTPQTIVIGHLNHAPVTNIYGRLVEIIRDRRLRTVTLDDVFQTSI